MEFVKLKSNFVQPYQPFRRRNQEFPENSTKIIKTNEIISTRNCSKSNLAETETKIPESKKDQIRLGHSYQYQEGML